jgi:hypothetical protein
MLNRLAVTSSVFISLALGLAACVEPPELGTGEDELMFDMIDPQGMAALYYGINPPRHAERSYQASDPAPPLSAQPTVVDDSGSIVVLATTIYNRPPFGRAARVSICDETGAALATRTLVTPARLDLHGLPPGTEVFIRPETMGTMAKLLTPEQIARAGL